MTLTEDDLPVLNDVIRAGDAAIIRSTRRRHATPRYNFDTGERMHGNPLDASGRMHFELPAHLQLEEGHLDEAELHWNSLDEVGRDEVEPDDADLEDAELEADLCYGGERPVERNEIGYASPVEIDEELESLIDVIVDRHIEALRRDLRVLIERVRASR